MEKFKVEDLQNKRYLLTTFPLKQRRRKIGDVKPHERAEAERKLAEEEDRPVPIQTVEIMLFQNMTFATAAGFGGTKILRGKWSIIGADKDQLWMQVLRFGFGRSVSGSTFSEGLGLTHEDQKGEVVIVLILVGCLYFCSISSNFSILCNFVNWSIPAGTQHTGVGF